VTNWSTIVQGWEALCKNEDIDEYDIIDADGRLIASVKITLHSDVKAPFKTTRSVQRTDR